MITGMETQLAGVQSPFHAVAEYPPALPYVGQDACYGRLLDFSQSMTDEERAHFFAIYGDWAMGKSRLAHELVAQACGKSQGWLLSDGTRAEPLLTPLAAGGQVFPLFISFLDVLKFDGEYGIDTRTAMGKITCAAVTFLADNQRARSSHPALLGALHDALVALNPNFAFDRVLELAHDASQPFPVRAAAIRDAFGRQTSGQVTRLLVMVDEVESAGETNPFADEIGRVVADQPIPLRAVRDLYEAVKEAATNADAQPGLNFLFFNTIVSRRVAHMEALERRMITADLEKASAADLEQLLRAVRATGYPMEGLLRDLGQRAFFAADRNLGWFSFIMDRAHATLVDKPDQSIDRIFEGVYQRTGKVFQPRYLEDRDIAPAALKDAMRRLIYNQVPATLAELDIAGELAAPLLAYQDPFQTRFIGEALAVEVSADQLTNDLLATTSYVSDAPPRLTGESSVKFDPASVLASLGTFAWERGGATPGTSTRLWVYADPADFQNQVMFAYRGYGENLSAATVRTIHRLLLERYTVAQSARLFAPTMAFLQRFNDLWGKAAANNWLTRNEQWERLITAVEQTPERNNERLLRGVANVFFDVPTEVKPSPYPTVKGTSLTLKLENYESLNVTARNQLVLLRARDTPEGVMEDLRAINQRVPVILLFSGASERDRWQHYLRANHDEHVAIGVVAHVVEPHTRAWEFYVRYALRDQAETAGGFKAGEMNEVGQDLRNEFKRELTAAFQTWLRQAEAQGYVLRPFFPATSANKPNFREFAAGWRALLAAGTFSALGTESQATAKALEDCEREQGDDTLVLVAGAGGARHAVIPPVVPRLLDTLTERPRKLIELESTIFYARSARAVSFPPQGAGVLDQLMTLLETLGVVEMDGESRYHVRSAQAIASKFDEAVVRLGDFGGERSGYAREVSGLSAPIQHVAKQLEVNESDLTVLKAQQLAPRQKELERLPLAALTTLPADTAAYTAVVREIGAITEALDRVLGKPGQVAQPPELDPRTLHDNINRIAADKEYHEYSIAYRVAFLRQTGEYLAAEERAVRDDVAAKRAQVVGMSAAGGFPTQPLLTLLDQVQADLEDHLPGNALPPALRRTATDLPLKTLKDANAKLPDALLKLGWYRTQLDATNADGWWGQYAAAQSAWDQARAAHDETRRAWTALMDYFKGTAEDHRTKFTGPGLQRDVDDLDESVAGFATNFDTRDTTLADLSAEITMITERSANIAQAIQTARRSAGEEIERQLNHRSAEAVERLAERKHSAMRLPDAQRVRDARTHEEAHRELQHYNEDLDKAGAALCEDANLFKRYLELYQDVQRQVSGDDLMVRHSKDVLEQMRQRDLVTLRTIVEL